MQIYTLFTKSGPKVINLSRVELILQIVLRAPNCTHTQEVEVIKLFHTRTHTQVEYKIGDFSSKLHSLLRTILKAVSAQNAIYNEICRAEFNECLNYTSPGAS